MYLKSLTLKGFKSFADPTTIELEPGVTVVVGPNGSGKSNVVDAVAWVLGAQGPRVVRSAKMDDVIFAGTEKRSALGRAEVSLTIDNSARRLPIDFHEITVTRTLFRTGESEYAINGAPCRLLDVQELLSDSGVGRQQHVIISQGQLDAVLTARPEDRRAIIEEAAGVLKYRRRRERAERRLESSEGGLARLQDLNREVQRQLKPLERQAASALRHDELVGEQRALRLHLARTELGDLHERLASAERRRAELDAETAITGADLARTWATLSLAHELPTDELAEDLAPLGRRLETQRQRARQVLALCQERRRANSTLAATLGSGDQVAGVEAEADRVARDLERTESEAEALAPQWEQLSRAETALELEEQDVLDRYGADEVPGPAPELAEARAASAAGRELLAAAREQLARTGERLTLLTARREENERGLAQHVGATEALALEEAAAAAEEERLAAAEQAGRDAAHLADESLRVAEEEVYAAAARVEALELALDEARARAGLERLAELPGVLGTLLDVVEVADSVGLAFEAALEWVLGGVLVAGRDEARAALEHLRRDGLGGSVLPLGDASARRARPAAPSGETPPGTEELRISVSSPDPAVEALLDELLGDVVLCRGGLDAALDASLAMPDHVVVTPEGDRLSRHGWRLGAGRAGATRAALDAARARAESARQRT
ncbi:MAG: smc, partial [Acidimicrobiaceae bacterium]|nr:smc [Acidimicrobiaceae bacterium]